MDDVIETGIIVARKFAGMDYAQPHALPDTVDLRSRLHGYLGVVAWALPSYILVSFFEDEPLILLTAGNRWLQPPGQHVVDMQHDVEQVGGVVFSVAHHKGSDGREENCLPGNHPLYDSRAIMGY